MHVNEKVRDSLEMPPLAKKKKKNRVQVLEEPVLLSALLLLHVCVLLVGLFLWQRDSSEWKTSIQALLLAIICPAEVSLRETVNSCQLLCLCPILQHDAGLISVEE